MPAAHPPTAGRPRAANTAQLRAAMVRRLTPRDRWLLAMLHEHRVLTTHQIRAAAFGAQQVTRRRLLTLWECSMLDRFRPQLRSGEGTAPWHWTLAPAGADVLAAQRGLSRDQIGYRAAASSLGHSSRLAHHVGVSEFFVGLIEHAQQTPGAALIRWWGEARCARLFGDLVEPDAYGRWRLDPAPAPPGRSGVAPGARLGPAPVGSGPAGPAEIEFFLEYDRGTERSAWRLAERLRDYARLAEDTAIVTPVLVWTLTAAREASLRAALHQAWTQLDHPTAVPVATASAAPAAAVPAREPAREPDRPGRRPTAADPVWAPLGMPGTQRLRLHQLTGFWRLPPLEPAPSPGSAPGPGAGLGNGTGPARPAPIASAPERIGLPAPDPMPPRSAPGPAPRGAGRERGSAPGQADRQPEGPRRAGSTR